MNILIRTAAVVARRDFVATVMSRTFVLFLIAPLFPIVFGLIFGSATPDARERAAAASAGRVIAVDANADVMGRLATAHDRLEAVRPPAAQYTLEQVELLLPDAKSAEALLAERHDMAALLTFHSSKPTLYGSAAAVDRAGPYIRLLLDEANRDRALGRAGLGKLAPPDLATIAFSGAEPQEKRPGPLLGQGAQTLLFVLTLMLVGVLLSNFIEEKGNKVIEVLAAAAPISAIFTGKLFAMLGSSLVGIAVWSATALASFSLILHQGVAALPEPAVGWPAFIALGFFYFSMNYLLVGALLLGIGAQASSVRQIQTISLPITMAQLLLYGLATAAFNQPVAALAVFAAFFPYSSPLTMIGYAAREPGLWPHAAALIWQAFWVVVTITVTARWFRRGVLKSGPARKAAPV